MRFTEAVVTTEGETSSNIAEMIEKLSQSEGLEVPKTNTEAAPMSTTFVARESSQSRDLLEDLLSPIPQPSKIQ